MAEPYQEGAFWLIFILIGFAGLRVVTTRNVVHAALWLVGTLLGAASMYVLLYAEFVAWVQVLVYVGAVVVLMLFGLMLTRAPIGSANFDNNQRLIAAACAGLLFLVTSFIMLQAFEGQEIDFTATEGTKVESIGEVIFSLYVLPFEIVSLLLLAALVGAVVISRRDEGPVSR
ncbi:MAG: NADH-quinone oxidoreductase subunit J family protein [Actinomycetota bacterium]